jgi:methionine salvage enolase-phosphatase E1
MASMSTDTEKAACIVAHHPMEADATTVLTEPTSTNNMNPEAEEFLQRLRAANAEDLRNRILMRVQAIIEQAGLSQDHLSKVDVDVSDYLREQGQQ